MEPLKPKEARPLHAPEGMADCETLWVVDELAHMPNGQYPAMRSIWQPSPEELAALNAGHAVTLTIYGNAHPPVWLGVSKKIVSELIETN